MNIIEAQDIQNILAYFAKNVYHAANNDPEVIDVIKKCTDLFSLDYNLFCINNMSGELSANYPGQLIILENELNVPSGSPASQGSRTTNTIYESVYDGQKLRDYINKARLARCRARFPLPVIFYRNKYICRSGTISGGPEIYGRSGLEYFLYGSDTPDEAEEATESSSENLTGMAQSDWQLLDRVRHQDIKLLKTFNVGTIIDFMVENKKRKLGVNVTSSEKVDKNNRYSEFTIVSLPYPGCEFFKKFRGNDYTAQGLVFNWAQSHVDANIHVPNDSATASLKIDWLCYKQWDLVTITQNYFKILIRYLQENTNGILIHCISGWDRTPLFISLLRLSLWADGVIHQSLNHIQILYLTIAYDWMLFGHHLVDRLAKGEEIFFFCFYMLKHIIEDEFSITKQLRSDSDVNLEGILLENDARGSNISLNSSCSSQSQEMPPMWFPVNQDEISNANSWTNIISGSDSNPSTSQASQNQNQNLVSNTVTINQPSFINNPNPLLNPNTNQINTSQMPWSPVSRRTSPVSVPVPPASRLRQRHESTSSLSTGSWQMITGTGSLRGSDSNPGSDTSQNANRCDGQISQDSSCTLIDEMTLLNPSFADLSFRRERLEAVRSLFYVSYSPVIGFQFKGGSESALSSLIGNLAERVGFSQRNVQ